MTAERRASASSAGSADTGKARQSIRTARIVVKSFFIRLAPLILLDIFTIQMIIQQVNTLLFLLADVCSL